MEKHSIDDPQNNFILGLRKQFIMTFCREIAWQNFSLKLSSFINTILPNCTVLLYWQISRCLYMSSMVFTVPWTLSKNTITLRAFGFHRLLCLWENFGLGGKRLKLNNCQYPHNTSEKNTSNVYSRIFWGQGKNLPPFHLARGIFELNMCEAQWEIWQLFPLEYVGWF